MRSMFRGIYGVTSLIIYFTDEVKERIIDFHEKIRSKIYTHRRKQVGRSDVWDVFHVIVNDEGHELDQFFYCIKCEQIMYIRSAATTQLLRHPCISPSSANIDTVSIDKLNKAAAKFVCMDLRPMHALEGEGLREIFKAGIELGKKYPKASTESLMENLPSRKSVKTIIANEANDAKQNIKAIFRSAIKEGGFGCTLDLWSDNYKHNSYMGMTANVYIATDDCIELKRIVFSMEHVTDIFKSKDLIKSKIIRVLNDFDVSREEIKNSITFTTDR